MANPNTPSFPYAAPNDFVLTVASDNAESTLNGDITSGDASIALTSAAGFTVPCLIVIDGEIILAQSKTSNTFNNCIRGFAGSSAASHTDSTNVFGYILAYQHNQMAAEVESVTSYLVGSDFSGFKTSENLILYSEDFTQGYWGKNSGVTIPGTSDALQNGSPGSELLEGSSSGINMISGTPAGLVVADTYTFSVYAKYDSVPYLLIGQNLGGSEHRWAWFNIQTGVVGTVGALAKASIVSVGGGWYRCLVVTTCTNNTNKNFEIALATADNSNTYLGTSTNFTLISGAQVRSGGFDGPLTYIKTSGTSFSLIGSGDLILDEGDLS